jgi:hypothetical protein
MSRALSTRLALAAASYAAVFHPLPVDPVYAEALQSEEQVARAMAEAELAADQKEIQP